MSLDPGVPLVLLASAVWDTPAPVNAHQIARRFAARGHPVLFVESTGLRAPALAAPHDLRRIAARLRNFVGGVTATADGVHVLSPLALPGAGRPWLQRVSEAWLARQIQGACRRLGFERPVLWAFLPTAIGFAGRIDHRGLVYQCVDDYAGNPGVDADWVRGLEERLVARADLVLATSPVLAERLRAWRPDVRLAANVADVAHFARALECDLAEPLALAPHPHPRVLYVGNVAGYRIDPRLLAGARAAAGDGTLVLVGETGLGDTEAVPEELAAVLSDPKVFVAGPQPHADLPAWMAHCDVALIPFQDNAHTRGSLPLKLYEYLAAGLPVVARDLPNLRGLEDQGVTTAPDAVGFEAQVRRALAAGGEGRAARSRAAASHGWEGRIDELARWIGESLP